MATRTKIATAGVLGGLLLASVMGASGASAAAGDPTPGFGSDGILDDQATAVRSEVAVNSQGITFLVTERMDEGDPGLAIEVRRYGPTGTLLGTTVVPAPEEFIELQDVSAAGAKVFILARAAGGPSGNHTLVIRVRGNGALDTSWGGDGIVDVEGVGQNRYGIVITAVPGGRVALVAGDIVLRLTSTGALDTTFSGDGRAKVPAPPSGAASDLMALPDGSLVMVGLEGMGAPRAFVSKLRSNGQRAGRFGLDGLARIGYPDADFTQLWSVDAAPDGSIVVGGAVKSPTMNGIRLLVGRVTANGRLDASFSDDGWLTIAPQGDQRSIGSVLVQADGKVIVTGQVDSAWMVTRLRPNGRKDSSFAGDGTVQVTVSENNAGWVSSSAIDTTNDRVVLAGSQNLVSAPYAIGLGSFALR